MSDMMGGRCRWDRHGGCEACEEGGWKMNRRMDGCAHKEEGTAWPFRRSFDAAAS